MATGTSRDVKLTLSVATLGEDNVRKLESAVADLTKAGGGAGPAFEALVAQIDRIAQESAAVKTFRDLSDATEALRARQEQTATTAQELATKLDVLRSATADAKSRQQEATQELVAGQQAYVSAGNAIRSLKTEYDNAGKQTDEYRQRLHDLTQDQGGSKLALIELRQAQKDATAEVSATTAAQGKLETSYTRTAAQADAATAALIKQEAALQASAAATEALGISTEDIATAEARLLQSVNNTVAAIDGRRQAILDTAEADRLLSIEERSLTELLQRGAQALQAEEAAQRDAAASARAYAEAKAAAVAANESWQREADGIVSTAEAAQQLTRQTTILLEAERELAAQAAFEKQASDAAGLLKAAEYVRFWEESLAQGEAQAKQTADAAAAAGAKIDNAFQTLGVRSAESLRAEIAQVREAMQAVGAQSGQTGAALNGAFAAGEAKIATLERDLRELNGTLTLGDRAASLFKNSLGQIAAGNIIADAVGYLVNKVKELGVAFVETIASTERYRRALNAIYKDAGTAAAQFEFLRDVALRSGVAVGDISQSFIKFSAATRSAGVSLQVTNDLFEGVTRAAGTLGLSGEDVTGILEALGQMASKGTVSMEELRQQLGDRLPGALSLVSKGLGITDGQLIKLVESGNLAARDLFPALTQALGTMQGEVTGITPAFENLKTALTTLAQEGGDAGWTVVLTGGLQFLTAAAGILGGALLGATNALYLIGATAVSVVASIVTLKNQFGFLGEEVDKAAQRQAVFSATIDKALSGTNATTAATKKLAEQTAQTALASAQLTTVTHASADAQRLYALGTKLAADNTLSLAARNIQLQLAINETLPALEARAVAAAKDVKSTKELGAALVAEAQLRGNVRDILATQVTASQNNVAAAQLELAARQAQTEVITLERNALVILAQSSNEEAVARKQKLDLLDKDLVKSQAATEQAKAAVATAQQETLARRIAIETYGDQSAAVDKLRGEMERATAASAAAAIAFAQGKITLDQYKATSEAATIATAKYNDSLSDAVKLVQAKGAAEQASYNVTLAGLSVQEQAQQQLAQAAAASGDYAGALYYEIEAKKTQITITELTAKARKAEAESARLGALADEELAIAEGKLTPIKQKEIEARLLNAKAKAIEADASATVIKGLEAEIDAINAKFRAAQQERDQRASGLPGIREDTSTRLENADAINKQSDALDRYSKPRPPPNKTSDGFKTNADGSAAGTFNSTLPVDKIFDIIARNKAGSLTADDLAAAKAAYADAQQLARFQNQTSGASAEGIRSAQNLLLGATNALQQVQSLVQRAGVPKTATSTSSPTSATPASSGKTINIVINGRSQSVSVSSQSDADTLNAILRQLESEANRTS